MEWDWADGFIRQHVMNKMLTLYNARWAVCVECVCASENLLFIGLYSIHD